MKKLFVLFVMSSLFFLYTTPFNEMLSPVEKARLRVFGIKASNDLNIIRKQRQFLNTHFSTNVEYDIYDLVGKSIQDSYNLYVAANISDELSKSVLEKNLPMRDYAMKVDSNSRNPIGYAIVYKWQGSKKLEVVTNKFKGKELCALEVLEFEQNNKGTILRTSFQQFCFDIY